MLYADGGFLYALDNGETVMPCHMYWVSQPPVICTRVRRRYRCVTALGIADKPTDYLLMMSIVKITKKEC